MTATVDPTSIKLRFPEFAAETDASVAFAIEEATRGFNSDKWGTTMNLALSNLVAHFLSVAIERRDGGGQVLASERIGEISMTYQTVTKQSADPSDYSTTPYGSRYLNLAKMKFAGPRVI